VTDPAPTAPEPATPEPLRFYRSFTVGPEFADKLASASFRHVLLSQTGLVRVAAVGLAFVAAAYITTVRSSGQAAALSIAGAGVVIYAILMAIAAVVGSRVERNRMRARVPAGTEFAVGFRETTILVRSPMDTAELEFARFQSWQEVGDFVMLRQGRSRILNFLPAECFTPESLAYLREKLGPPANSRR
jgi:hypothetical protein